MLDLVTIRERPDLRDAIHAETFNRLWPTFVMHDPVAALYFKTPYFDRYLDTAFAVPFAFGEFGRDELPDSGWDGVIRWAHEDQVLNRRPNALSVVSKLTEAAVMPPSQPPGARSSGQRRVSCRG